MTRREEFKRRRGTIIALIVVAAVVWLWAIVSIVNAADLYMGPPSASPGGSSGSCTTSGSACDVWRVLEIATCGQTLQINNGIYQGTRYMMDFALATVGSRVCSAASPIQIVTESDGGAFFDGEFLRRPMRTHAISYWYFDGFDAGNSSNSVFANTSTVAGASNNLIVRRVCFSNAKPVPGAPIPPQNEHVIDFSFIDSSLFVDVCGFGTGRTVITDYGEDTTHNANNVFRRVWLRWEGFPVSNNSDGTFCAPTPPLQYGYLTKGPAIWENIISIHDPEQYNLATWGTWTSCSSGVPYAPGITPARGASTFTYPGGAYTFRGLIVYGYNGFTSVGQTAMRNGEAWTYSIAAPSTFVDFYHDSRSQANGTGLVFFCTAAVAPACTSNSADRLTNIRVSTGTAPQYDTFGTAVPTNSNDCIATSGATGASLGGCPSFYTGDTPGTGARNCFRYVNGVLTSTPLWPWPMDGRIKAALARAKAAGTGGSDLAGIAGTGYDANTVTSEIVSRYGAIPLACSGALPPPAPTNFVVN